MRRLLGAVAALVSGCLCSQPADELEAGWPIEVLDASIDVDDAVTSTGCWSPAQIVGPFAGRAVGAMAPLPNGDVMVVWLQTELNPNRSRLFARRFHSNGTADRALQLHEASPFMFNLSVHTGADGRGFVMWREEVGGAVVLRRLTAAGTWAALERIPLDAARKVQRAAGAVAANGAAVIATIEYDESLGGSSVRIYEDGQSTELASMRFVRSGLRVVIGADGTQLVAWQSHGSPDNEEKTSVAVRRANGAWQHEFVGSSVDSWSGLSVLADRPSVSWVSQHTLRHARLEDGGWLLDDDVLSLAGSVNPGPAMMIEAPSKTALIFQHGSTDVLLTRFDGAWSSPGTLSQLGSNGPSRYVLAARGPGGTSLAGWTNADTLEFAHFDDSLRVTDRTTVDGIVSRDEQLPPQLLVTDDGTQWLLGQTSKRVEPEFNVVVLRCR